MLENHIPFTYHQRYMILAVENFCRQSGSQLAPGLPFPKIQHPKRDLTIHIKICGAIPPFFPTSSLRGTLTQEKLYLFTFVFTYMVVWTVEA